MKDYLSLLRELLFIPFYSCRNTSDKELLQFSPYPLEVPEQNSLLVQWEKKPVPGTKLIEDMESGTGWEPTVIGV